MKRTMNLAMQITMLRIVVTPCIVTAIFYNQWIIALTLSMIAALTDFFDGYFARKYNQETEFGKMMDPVADKIFMFFTLCALYYVLGSQIIPTWFMIILFVKEFLLFCGACFLARRNFAMMSPSFFSKTLTALLMAFILYLIAIYCSCISQYFSDDTIQAIFALFAVGTMIICADYGYKFYKLLSRSL